MGDTIEALPTPSPEEFAAALAAQALNFPSPAEIHAPAARMERDALLDASDWTQAADAPLTVQQVADWRAYRAALRAVPQQPGFPLSIEWPAPPGEAGAVPAAPVEVPRLYLVDRLIALDKLQPVLGLLDQDAELRERWYASTSVRVDDANLLRLLGAVGVAIGDVTP